MQVSERAAAWAETMEGHGDGRLRTAHETSAALVGPVSVADRAAREALEDAELAPGATRASGAGNRVVEEAPDPLRTCFERDRDRILHSTAFRRLAGKTQVFIFPEDHQRTRLTHALEVAQVASSIARACRLNVALTEAIALGHDCGHGPGGHASEDAFAPFVDGGYDHAVWGADVVLAPLNLCAETLDGVRNHSWSRPAPSTPEGEVVSWADRVAYVCHDFEDAVRAGIVTPGMLPPVVRELCGDVRSRQLGAFISDVVSTVAATGRVGMSPELAGALAEFRRFNYERIYMRPASLTQGAAVVRVLQALVSFYADRPNTLPLDGEGLGAGAAVGAGVGAGVNPSPVGGWAAGSPEALREAVAYVAGMTDRFALSQAVARLGFDPAHLPFAAESYR